ncbi:MAG: protoheme IX farnesyltransferase [Nitrospiraceae bacterium]|nr:MAG: protoheme IX farnesyltransferase [Nitrospiraceae bacterium]
MKHREGTAARPVSAYGELCKLRVSLFSALSAFTGVVLAGGPLSGQAVIAVFGVFVLACGASALNQYQERGVDALMKRTGRRPIPSGRIRPLQGLFFSAALLLAGSVILSAASGPVPLLLGIFAVIWYNGIYTWLKPRTAFAAVPGALIGAIPPAMGWTAAGGSFNSRLAALCLFFFIWQVPHFWLIIMAQGSEYRKAGLASLTGIFSWRQLARITFVWIFAAAAAGLLLPLYGISLSPVARVLLVAASLWLLWTGAAMFGMSEEETAFPRVFRAVNVYVLMVMILLSFDIALA